MNITEVGETKRGGHDERKRGNWRKNMLAERKDQDLRLARKWKKKARGKEGLMTT